MRWKNSIAVLALFLCLVLATEHDVDDDVVVEDEAENTIVDDPNLDVDILNYESPESEHGNYYLAEHFDDHNKFVEKWIKSEAKKDDIAEEIAKYDGVWENEAPQKAIFRNDLALVLKSKAKHAAISSRLYKPVNFKEATPLVVQYEVTMQEGQECGGSYIKLLTAGKENADLTKFNDKTPYTIMFGPDKCGNDIKLHFIFRHVNPLNGTITEKHCRKPKERLEEPFKDKEPHLYQLVINPDNTFKISVDHRVINEGTLLSDFEPPVNPPREIDDPEDKKPSNWDEREKIPDPHASKPEDWDEEAPPQIPDPNAVKPDGWLDDEEEMIPDPNAKKPDDWDNEMDGDWEAPLIENPICEKAVGCGLWKAPLIPNPQYKGTWRAPLIENPNYQGKWVPKKIPNPDFFQDLSPFENLQIIDSVGIELWSMSSNILFDNMVITDDEELANAWAAKTYDLKRKHIDKSSKTLWERAMRHMGYKPGWWALYFLYVAIPFSLYIRYLVRRYKEDKKAAQARADAKKTDEPIPEDEEIKEVTLDDEKKNDAETDKQTSPKSKKSDLDVDQIENLGENEDAEEDEEEEEDEVEEANSDNLEDANAEPEVTEEITIPPPTVETNATEGTRKRHKPRRE